MLLYDVGKHKAYIKSYSGWGQVRKTEDREVPLVPRHVKCKFDLGGHLGFTALCEVECIICLVMA